MEVGEGIYSGFDVSDGDFRIFVQRNNMIFGMGNNNQSQPQFTVGGYYNALDNLWVSLDYVINFSAFIFIFHILNKNYNLFDLN